jgi:hypothetical protein|tara:strand:- start:317 stop:466 length:150 start_codon:yes stop_codon:yes gene_type:complete
LQDFAARRDLGVFEHSGGVGTFFSKNLSFFILVLLQHSSFHLLDGGAFL